jgi:signal peptidase II
MLKNMKNSNLVRWIGVSLVVVFVDQLSKWLIVNSLQPGEALRLLPFLNFRLIYNPGAAFSFLSDAGGWQVYFFLAVALMITVFLMVWLSSLSANHKWQSFSLALIIGGALGNLIDRIRLHKVVDFIDFHIKTSHFPTFNVADSAVTIGVTILIICLVFTKEAKQ